MSGYDGDGVTWVSDVQKKNHYKPGSQQIVFMDGGEQARFFSYAIQLNSGQLTIPVADKVPEK